MMANQFPCARYARVLSSSKLGGPTSSASVTVKLILYVDTGEAWHPTPKVNIKQPRVQKPLIRPLPWNAPGKRKLNESLRDRCHVLGKSPVLNGEEIKPWLFPRLSESHSGIQLSPW